MALTRSFTETVKARAQADVEFRRELLREALPWMSRQAAGLHPVSYAVWFDYVAQTNPPLRAAIDEYLAKEGALDEFASAKAAK